jgi:hypothetical protein
MKKLIGYLFYIVSFSMLNSCSESDPCHRASSNIITEERDVKDFKGVAFTSQGDIFLTQGPEYKVSIQGPDNVIGFTTSKVENELLVIHTDACFNGEFALKIEITAPEFTFLNLSGLGSITSVNDITGNVLVMELLGIGIVEADVYVDSLYTTISGNGTINYTGEVLRHELSSSGEFRLNAYTLLTDHTKINLTGIGDSYVLVNESLSVNISGTGKVFYQGDPTVEENITGTGEVIDDN